MEESLKQFWFTDDILEGIARIFDGFCIAAGIAIFTYLGGKLQISIADVIGLITVLFCCLGVSIMVRKLKND